MWARGFGCLFVLVACVPADPPLVGETSTSGTTSSSLSEVSGGSFSSTPTSTSGTSIGADLPISGEWVGTYIPGFAFNSSFLPCGSDELWTVSDDTLSRSLFCTEETLWLRVVGTVYEDPENFPGSTVLKIESFEGPCLVGSCEEGPSNHCDTVEGLCLDGECHPVFQNCPEGEKCAPSSGGGVCVPLDPNPVGVGEPCTRDPEDFGDTCVAGSLCQVADPQVGDGECVPICTGTYSEPVCDDPNLVCLRGSGYAYCLSPCDPLLGDCPDTHTCIYGGYENNIFVCYETAKADQGLNEPCESLTDCVDGLVCVDPARAPCDPNETGCCAAFCDLGEPVCEVLNTECVPWEDPPPGLEELGVCIFPDP